MSLDLTLLAENMKTAFVKTAKEYLVVAALAIPGVGPVAAWFIKTLLAPLITWLLTRLADWSAMQVFFISTVIQKNTQATDYLAAIQKRKTLGKNPATSKEDYEKAERAELEAFKRLVSFTAHPIT